MRTKTTKTAAKPQITGRAKLASKPARKTAKVSKPAAKAKATKPAATPPAAAEVPEPAAQPIPATTPAPAAQAVPIVRTITAAQLDKRAAREAKDRAAKIETIEKQLRKKGDDARCVGMLGRAAGPGWVLTATDGHRALIRPGVATAAGTVPAQFLTVAGIAIDFTRDIVSSLQRMVAAGSKDMEFKTTIALEGITHQSTRGVLHLTVKNPNAGVDEATEPIEVTGHGLRAFTGTVNGKYLLQAGGLYPSTLHVSGCAGDAILFQVVAPEARILIMGFGKNAAFPAGEAPAVRAEAPITMTIAPPAAETPATTETTTAPATASAPRVRPAKAPGDLTACECCGQPSIARTATTGKTRFSHRCGHGNPCPTGVAKKTIASCPLCRDRAAQVPAETAVSA